VAAVILHVHKYDKKVTSIFKSGGLHEKHVVATWKLGNHLRWNTIAKMSEKNSLTLPEEMNLCWGKDQT